MKLVLNASPLIFKKSPSKHLAPSIRNRILQSGDQNLVRVLKILPEESFARLRDILL